MVLVAGATGLVGAEVCRQLTAQGAQVRALVRETSAAARVAGLEQAGVEVVRGDLRRRGSLDAACRGIEAVVSTVSSMPFSWQADNTITDVDVGGQKNLIEAARSGGVRRLVFVSFPDDPQVQFALGRAKRATEKLLKTSGMEYTSLWANWFMEVWLSPAFGFDYNAGKAAVFGDGSNRLSWVSFVDVARTAAAAVTAEAARNSVLPVGGPEALSPLEVVRIFEKQAGRKWSVDHVPLDALRAQKAEAPDEVKEAVAALQIMYASSRVAMDPTTYLVRSRLTTVADYARSVLARVPSGS
jgi:NADH dehydrogenase